MVRTGPAVVHTKYPLHSPSPLLHRWQIDSYWKGHLGLPTSDDAFIAALEQPLTNAEIANDILGLAGYSAWSTYTSGAYKQFLP